MSQSQADVEIIDRRTGDSVSAILHKGLEELEIIDVEIDWSPVRLKALRRLREVSNPEAQLPQHVHWNWAIKGIRHSGQLSYQTFGIEAEGKMQGLMIACLDGKCARLDPDKGKSLVYVDFVETAPWNAKQYTDSPAYKGVGIRLIQAATELSFEYEFEGRVGLHSLPQSEPFYTHACEMQALGPDPSYHNLHYFELTSVKAEELKKK